jgi:hypothetical protein
MKKRMMLAAAGVILACSLSCASQDKGYWRAASTETAKMTGDISIADLKVSINFASFPLAPIRSLKPVEVSAVFDADVNAGISGDLYRLHIPANKYIVKHNTLCGGEETQWMATYVTGRTLRVAFFSGDDMPVFSFDAMQKSTALCGTYVYMR